MTRSHEVLRVCRPEDWNTEPGTRPTVLVVEVLVLDLECLFWNVCRRPQRSKLSFTVWARPQIATATAEPYNTFLCVHSLLVHTDATAKVDHEALYDSWRNNADIGRLDACRFEPLARSDYLQSARVSTIRRRAESERQ